MPDSPDTTPSLRPKLRVVQTCIRYPPALGGVETYVESMVDALVTGGHEVTVVTSDLAQHLPGLRRELTAAERQSDVSRPYRVIRGRSYRARGFDAYPIVPTFARRLVGAGVDVAHLHCWYYPSVDLAAAAARLRGTPIVLSPHLPDRAGRKWRVYRRAMGWTFAVADVVTSLTEFERAFLIRSGLPVKSTYLMPPAVPLRAGGGMERPDGRRRVLFVGRQNDTKGVDTLLRALPDIVSAHPDVEIVLAGPSPDKEAREYTQLLVEQGNANRVRFEGEVSADRLDELYREAAVFVLPSRYEAYGIVALEAMATGVPVVVADSSALPEVVDYGRLGLLHRVGDPADLAVQVNSLLADRAMAAEYGALGRRHVEKHHSLEAQRDRLEEVYAMALKARPVRRRSRQIK